MTVAVRVTVRIATAATSRTESIQLLNYYFIYLYYAVMILVTFFSAFMNATGQRRRVSLLRCSLSLNCDYCHTYYYWYSITRSLFHSRLKSFLFCKSSLPHPFLFLIQVSLYGFPRLFTVTSEHVRLFTF